MGVSLHPHQKNSQHSHYLLDSFQACAFRRDVTSGRPTPIAVSSPRLPGHAPACPASALQFAAAAAAAAPYLLCGVCWRAAVLRDFFVFSGFRSTTHVAVAMPNKCCVPACSSNYRTGEKVQVFSFPKDEVLRTKWLRAIPRKDFVPTENNKVRNYLLHGACIVRVKRKLDYSF